MPDTCKRCQGRLHVRLHMGTWVRCPDCSTRVVSLAYIKRGLRGSDPTLPPEAARWPSLPLHDAAVFHPDHHVFRRWAWRSLLDYEMTGLVYDWIEGYRLVDAFFEQDTEYPNVRAIQDLQLLIMDFSTVRVPNSMLGGLFVQTLTGRQRRGMPTWCYVQDIEPVRRLFGSETTALLEMMRVPTPGTTVAPIGAAPVTRKAGRFDPTSV